MDLLLLQEQENTSTRSSQGYFFENKSPISATAVGDVGVLRARVMRATSSEEHCGFGEDLN